MNNSYEDFLKSDAWREVREKRIAIDGGECLICKSRENLQVHHISYNDLLDLNNLRTVCKRCHDDIHNFYQDVAESSKAGSLKAAMDNYDNEMAKIMDNYVFRREKTLNDFGDTYLMTHGNNGGINKYINALLTWQPYADPVFYCHRYNCGISYTRYNQMRLKRKEQKTW